MTFLTRMEGRNKNVSYFYGEEVEVELYGASFKSPKVLDGEGLISEWKSVLDVYQIPVMTFFNSYGRKEIKC